MHVVSEDDSCIDTSRIVYLVNIVLNQFGRIEKQNPYISTVSLCVRSKHGSLLKRVKLCKVSFSE